MAFLPQDRAATDALWEDNKDILRKLYISENMTLDQVRGIMAEFHNFDATNSQYERKFKQWGFRKHCKKKDWVTISQVISKRRREGKESEVLMDGALLPLKKVRKEINRNEPTYSLEAYSRAPTPKVPEGFMIRTPLASPSPKMPTRAMTYAYSPVSAQGMPEDMILIPRAASRPREYQNTSFQEPVPLKGEVFWGIDLPFFKFVAFYNLRVGGSHMYNGRLSELHHEKPENSSRILGIKSNSSSPQVETALESIRTTVLNCVAQTTGRSVVRSTSLLLSTMHSIMPKVDIEGPFPVIQTMEQPTENDKATEMVKFMFFLLSNNLLDTKTNVTASEAVISWLRSNEGTLLIEDLPIMEGAGFESIVEKLFQSAILVGDLPTVKALLRTGLQPDKQVIQNKYGRKLSPLLLACESNNIELAGCLIKAGADVNGVNVTANNTNTPLIAAIRSSDSELVSLLLKKGAQANRPDLLDFQPLIEAAETGDIEKVQLLLSAGAEVKSKQDSHYTALHAAFYIWRSDFSDHERILQLVKLLLKAGVDINSSLREDSEDPDRYYGMTALEMAAYRGFLDIIKLLLSHGAEMTDATLCFATRSGITRVVHFLLDAGANINGKAEYGNTALKQAIRAEGVEMVEILLRRGAIVNDLYQGHAMTPLQEACYVGHVDLAKTLLEAGAVVNADAGENPWSDDDTGFEATALQAAAHSGSAELVRVLLNAGANPNAPVSRYGEAPLVAAARRKDVCLVTLLLDAGANVNQTSKSDENKTALQYAIEWGNASIIEELLDAGAEISGSTVDSESVALIAAVKSGDMTHIQNLLDQGVDINSPPAKLDGKTALSAAAGEDNLDLVRYLLSIGADSNDSAAILLAVKKRASIEIIRTLLTARLNVYKCIGKKYGGAALQRAIRSKDIERVRVLLDAGVDVNSYVSKGNHGSQISSDRIRSRETAFGTAVTQVKADDLHLVRLLLAAGADPSSTVVTSPKRTALILAIPTGSLSLIRLLIEAGGLVNAPAVRGLRRTALQAAVEAGDLKLIQLLLSAGADVNAAPAPYGGVTALQAAAIKGYITVANTLLSHGAHVNAEPAKVNGRTALEGAAEYGRIDMLQLLLDAGAQTEGSGQAQYENAMNFASKNGHNAARRLLESYRAQQSVVLEQQILPGGDSTEPDRSLGLDFDAIFNFDYEMMDQS